MCMLPRSGALIQDKIVPRVCGRIQDKIVPRVVIDRWHGSQQMSIRTGVMGATKCLS